MFGVFPCRDGWVDFTIDVAKAIPIAREFFGSPEWLNDEKWDAPEIATKPDVIDEFNAHLYEFLAPYTRHEVWEMARRARAICGPLFGVDDVFHDANFRARGFWQHTEEPAAFDFPGRPFLMSETAWQYRRAAPHLGQDTFEVLGEAGFGPQEIREMAAAGLIGQYDG